MESGKVVYGFYLFLKEMKLCFYLADHINFLPCMNGIKVIRVKTIAIFKEEIKLPIPK